MNQRRLHRMQLPQQQIGGAQEQQIAAR